MARHYPFPAEAGVEPPLSELLADPVLHTLLRRDGITVEDVLVAVRGWRHAQLAAGIGRHAA